MRIGDLYIVVVRACARVARTVKRSKQVTRKPTGRPAEVTGQAELVAFFHVETVQRCIHHLATEDSILVFIVRDKVRPTTCNKRRCDVSAIEIECTGHWQLIFNDNQPERTYDNDRWCIVISVYENLYSPSKQ